MWYFNIHYINVTTGIISIVFAQALISLTPSKVYVPVTSPVNALLNSYFPKNSISILFKSFIVN